MDEPAKNSIWNYLIPLWHLEQVSSIFGRRGVEVSLTSHCCEVPEEACTKQVHTSSFFDIINSCDVCRPNVAPIRCLHGMRIA